MEHHFDIFNSNFMPHGHCYFWEPYILWSHALSDGIIALAYMTIPLSLVKIVRGRKEDDFAYLWMLILFAIFILGCGATHVMDVINIWEPWYLTDSAIRIVTAIASIGTAILLMRITPQLILMPSGRRWKEMNEELKSLNESLEEKVQERTQELERMAEHFKFVTNAIPQIVWTAAPQGEVNFFNQNWYAFSGLNEESSIIYGWSEKVHPDDREEVLELWNKSVEGKVVFEHKLRMADAQGSYFWFLVRGIPMKDAAGNVTQWFGTNTNIHDQILKTEELERINDELDNFVYTASHDLRTPVINLTGLQQVLKSSLRGKANPKEEEFLRLMDVSVQRLEKTITELAGIAKVSRENLSSETLSFSSVLQDVLTDVAPLVEQTRAQIVADFQVDEISYPPSHLKSILYNLLSNAIKYSSPERQSLVTVSTFMDKGRTGLKVQDNGLGLKPEQVEKLFIMYKRLHSHVEGSGVGLTMIKRIVENHGGRIFVESRPGEGTSFTVIF